MGFIERQVRVYLCDRCGDVREIEGAAPVPTGWTPILYGADVTTAITHAKMSGAYDKPLKADWLCIECMSWLRKFLEGRKVAD